MDLNTNDYFLQIVSPPRFISRISIRVMVSLQ